MPVVPGMSVPLRRDCREDVIVWHECPFGSIVGVLLLLVPCGRRDVAAPFLVLICLVSGQQLCSVLRQVSGRRLCEYGWLRSSCCCCP